MSKEISDAVADFFRRSSPWRVRLRFWFAYSKLNPWFWLVSLPRMRRQRGLVEAQFRTASLIVKRG